MDWNEEHIPNKNTNNEILNGIKAYDNPMPTVSEVSITYYQEGDNYDREREDQRIRFTTRPADGCFDDNNEFPFYVNMEILPRRDGTVGHWSFDDFSEVVKVYEDFKKKVMTRKRIKPKKTEQK